MSQPGQPTNYVTDSLTSVPAPAPIQVGSNGSPGGYQFAPDQVQAVINKWQDLLHNLQQDIRQAQRVASVRAPAVDPASGQFVSNGSDPSGQTLLVQHQRMVRYVQNYIDALNKASGTIHQAEADAQQVVAQSGQGVM